MRSANFHLLIRGLAGLLLAACATGGVTPLMQDPHVITAPELRDTRAAHAYEAIQRLHPEYLRTRGPSSIINETAMGPAVFVDRAFVGGVEVLADLPVDEIARIEFRSAWDATTRYGQGYANGVIEVTTWRGGQ